MEQIADHFRTSGMDVIMFLALDEEFLGAVGVEELETRPEWTQAQQCGLQNLEEHVVWFLGDAPVVVGPQDWAEVKRTTNVDYQGKEPPRPLALRLEELKRSSPEIKAFFTHPSDGLLPEHRW